MFRTFGQCVFLCKQFWYSLKGGGHNVFKAVNLPTNWLKIPKSVNVTDFPVEQLLSTYCTWPKYVVTPKTKFWSMDVSGRDPVILLWAWWVSLALSRSLLTCVILRVDSCTIICACLPTTPLRVR